MTAQRFPAPGKHPYFLGFKPHENPLSSSGTPLAKQLALLIFHFLTSEGQLFQPLVRYFQLLSPIFPVGNEVAASFLLPL